LNSASRFAARETPAKRKMESMREAIIKTIISTGILELPDVRIV